ncbi:peroxisomal ATPase PEX6 isoform X2 [Cylas formicarius]|uniref:peroxisomal ATPase PEX6 isoform X2 n=1 Tax=Cylas formicarius TaxID=197179 RepID=UPI002958400B|nr:peroxisomal ATPase PEX6 isoform X2 [Cylas formicarius]
MDKMTTILYISSIIYPKYKPHWFVFYMYLKYHGVLKRQIKYKATAVSDEIIFHKTKSNSKYCADIHNVVLVKDQNIYPNDLILSLFSTQSGKCRKVFVIPCELSCNTLLFSNALLYNFGTTSDNFIQLLPTTHTKFAQEVELSLISSPHDISNFALDSLIKNYFQFPKIIYAGDIIQINVEHFSKEDFYSDLKLNLVQRVYLKCNRVTDDEAPTMEGRLCAIGETTIRQAANIQSYVPKVLKVASGQMDCDINSCPNGLKHYFQTLEKAVKPFLRNSRPNLTPAFLIQGEEGCGSDILLKSLALKLGVHLYRLASIDLSANVYAQNESKLNYAFFTAKMSAPCIVFIDKFQNFAKNNEGQYDQRLISNFKNQLEHLFENNEFPVILFCSSEGSNIAPDMKRLFLETFEVNAPTDEERELILRWLLDANSTSSRNVDLKNVANKTHGFYFEDLKALVYHAKRQSNRKALTEDDFQIAIDFMQSNYNESLGAPKVPKVQWSDVGGLEDVKNEIVRTINLPLLYPELLKKSGLRRSGILLFGPPGTGKTLIAKAVATECSLCFLAVKGPELLNMYVGQSEQNVREVFERARQATPCVIFFDELDSLAPNRGLSGDSGGVMDRVVSQLLAEMDGLDESGKVFVIGATNRPDLIDPALLRPGRFDKLLYVGPCTDIESQKAVLNALTRKFNFEEDMDLDKVIKMCPKNITGADFYGLCSSAWFGAAKRLIEQKGNVASEEFSHEDVVVGFQDFVVAIDNVKPSISREDLLYFENLKKDLWSNYRA